jgi:hypothetical protein
MASLEKALFHLHDAAAIGGIGGLGASSTDRVRFGMAQITTHLN